MAGSKSDNLEKSVLQYFLRADAASPVIPQPTAHVLSPVAYPYTVAPPSGGQSASGLYVALYTVAPGETGGGTEVTGGSYQRQPIMFGATSSDVDAYKCSNTTADILFPISTAPWGTIVAFAILNAYTGGSMLYYGTVGTQKAVASGEQAKIAIGALIIKES
jgi:hypothetical protein